MIVNLDGSVGENYGAKMHLRRKCLQAAQGFKQIKDCKCLQGAQGFKQVKDSGGEELVIIGECSIKIITIKFINNKDTKLKK